MPADPPNGGVIALDAMGSDLGPAENVAAVRLALGLLPSNESVTLVGDEAVLTPALRAEGLIHHPRVRVAHASETIAMDDKPLQALKRKRDASMFRAIELVKNGGAQAVVSCGNTGALMASATLRLRTMQGIDRPALAAVMPHRSGHFVLIDAGANPGATPEHLVHNAILGSNYASAVMGLPRPRVGLLTIGTEEGKGNELATQSHELLKRLGAVIDYRGPIEGFHVFDNQVDVIVCDGFTGNVLLKTCESLFVTLKGFLKDELLKNPVRKIGAFLAKGAFVAMKEQLNPERYGGAPLLGLRGYVLKAHGSSNRHAVSSALVGAASLIKRDMNHRIESDVARAADLIRHAVA